jgi:hypothetical protein
MELSGAVIDCESTALVKNDVRMLTHFSKMRFERYSRRYMIATDGIRKDYVVKDIAEFVSTSLIEIVENDRDASVCGVLLYGSPQDRSLVVEQVLLRSFSHLMQRDFLNIPITLRGCGMVLSEIQAILQDKTYVVIAMRLVTLFFKDYEESDELLELFEHTIISSNDVRGEKMVEIVFQMLETLIINVGTNNGKAQRTVFEKLQKSYNAIIKHTDDSLYDTGVSDILVSILWASWGGKNEGVSLGMTSRQTYRFVMKFIEDTRFIREFCRLNIIVCNGVYEEVVCGLAKVLQTNQDTETATLRMEPTSKGFKTIQSLSILRMEPKSKSCKRPLNDSRSSPLESWGEAMESTFSWD